MKNKKQKILGNSKLLGDVHLKKKKKQKASWELIAPWQW
jgi:hypothetical protein